MTRIALFGAGRMGRVHAQSILTAGAEVTVVYDKLRDNAEKLALNHAATVASTPEEALSRQDVDAVVIATPSDTHKDLIVNAVRAGKPVLCEKPLASSLAETEDCIAAIGEKAARKVYLGFNRRRDRGHEALCNAVHAGEIGQIEQLIITSRDPAPPPPDYILHSGGIFRDMTIHDFDMARSIVGEEFTRVTATGSCIVDPRIGELGDIDSATVVLETQSGVLVTIINSRHSAFGFDQRIEAFGDRGMLISDNPRQSGVRSFTSAHPGTPAPILEFFMERYGPSYTAEIKTFIECVNASEDMPVNAIDGLMAVYLAEAATASLEKRSSVNLANGRFKNRGVDNES
ncbi:inositol 2-dehydrogenase [Salinisphaera sp.]|uniref:inositol 2-dehydrogenase n=1 Tax=Salinisphaera sp. TaxID=1914330 RepID=UPI002D767EBF|nr:inositol 2-dehydrogenase [Salinisphaera sp.]HET7313852.1 inositol 2-dehydrogenase [Salinisphaera sp.]